MDWKLPSCLTCCRCFYSWETWGHRKRPIDRVDFPLTKTCEIWQMLQRNMGDKYYAMLHCGNKKHLREDGQSWKCSWVTSDFFNSPCSNMVHDWFMWGEFEELPTQDYEQTHWMPPVLEDLEGKINMMSSLINELYLCKWYIMIYLHSIDIWYFDVWGRQQLAISGLRGTMTAGQPDHGLWLTASATGEDPLLCFGRGSNSGAGMCRGGWGPNIVTKCY